MVRQNNVHQTAAAEPSYDSLAPQAASPAIKVYPVGVKAGMLVVRMVTSGGLLTDKGRSIE